MTNEKLVSEARRLENDYGDSYEVMTHMSALADALEAATRVPVQGEPNNRENCPGSGGHAGCGTYCIVCDLLTVEPSSTVDEAALARVVRSALPYDVEVSPARKSKTERHFRTAADGDLHVERITRAVAEYLTGGTK